MIDTSILTFIVIALLMCFSFVWSRREVLFQKYSEKDHEPIDTSDGDTEYLIRLKKDLDDNFKRGDILIVSTEIPKNVKKGSWIIINISEESIKEKSKRIMKIITVHKDKTYTGILVNQQKLRVNKGDICGIISRKFGK